MLKRFHTAALLALGLTLIACSENADGLPDAQSAATSATNVADSGSASGSSSNQRLFSAQAADSTQTEEMTINSFVISESSGLARSNINRNIVWTHNDSGGNVAVYALTHRGAHVATFSVQGIGVINLDWEDMTSAVIDKTSYLFVADVGDNNAFRPFTTVYMMPEPKFDIPRFGIASDVVNVSAIFNLVFPDATPRDVESLAIDGAGKTGYIISKREEQPRLFSFSLESALAAVPQNAPPVPVTIVMEDLGPINIPRAPADFKGNRESFNWVTSMDFSHDGLMAYVGTLLNGYIYTRTSVAEDWKTAFSRKPLSVNLPAYSQIEAGAFDIEGRSVFITSENYPARMARIPVGAFGAAAP